MAVTAYRSAAIRSRHYDDRPRPIGADPADRYRRLTGAFEFSGIARSSAPCNPLVEVKEHVGRYHPFARRSRKVDSLFRFSFATRHRRHSNE